MSASPSPYSTRSTGRSSPSSGAPGPFRFRSRALEPGHDRKLFTHAQEHRLRCRARVRRGEAELLGLLEAQSRHGDARERKEHIAVRERRSGARLDPHAERRPLRFLPEARGRPRFEVDLVDARLLVEGRPRAVRIDARHVRAHGRRKHHLRPTVSVEGREVARPRLLCVRMDRGAEVALDDPDPPSERGRERLGGAGHRLTFERRLRRGDVGLLRVLRPLERFVENGAKLAHPHRELGPERARHGTLSGSPALGLGQELRRPALEGGRERRVGRDAPQAIGIEPVCRGLGERLRVDGVGRVRELRARLGHDRARRLAAQRGGLTRGHAEGVCACVVGVVRLAIVGGRLHRRHGYRGLKARVGGPRARCAEQGHAQRGGADGHPRDASDGPAHQREERSRHPRTSWSLWLNVVSEP